MSGLSPAPVGAAEEDLRLLVVDDNEISRVAIRRQLELLGHTCELSASARAALERLHSRRYALVLAECVMREMDGFELARIIRSEERRAGSHLPIVAVTSNAIGGEKARCAAVGMDDCLSRPVEIDALRAVLQRFLPVSTSTRNEILDPQALVELIGGDFESHAHYFTHFVHQGAQIVADMLAANAAGSTAVAQWNAHKLKSSAAAVGAGIVAAVCRAIEAAAVSQDRAELHRQCVRLQHEMGRVESRIACLLAERSRS